MQARFLWQQRTMARPGRNHRGGQQFRCNYLRFLVRLKHSAGCGRACCVDVQAKAIGEELVVGLIPDNEILRCKGPPVMNEEERFTLVDAVKWVDEVITGALPPHQNAVGSAIILVAHTRFPKVPPAGVHHTVAAAAYLNDSPMHSDPCCCRCAIRLEPAVHAGAVHQAPHRLRAAWRRPMHAAGRHGCV